MSKNNSNSYLIKYAIGLVVGVAALLALAATVLKDKQQENILIEKKGDILTSIGVDINGAKNKSQFIEELYNSVITATYFVNSKGEKTAADSKDVLTSLDHLRDAFEIGEALPLFEAMIEGRTIYVIPLNGKGLFGSIWGYMAISDDGNTLQGAKFDHSGETPGLGAEIATPHFSDQFIGKTIFEGDQFVSISVLKGQGISQGNAHAVDAVSGGTLTSNGVREMLNVNLRAYLPFFESLRKSKIDTGSKVDSEINITTGNSKVGVKSV